VGASFGIRGYGASIWSFPGLRSGGTAFALGLAFLAALPVLAQQTQVYQDGGSWVEETTGTLSPARELRISTDLGSLEVRGKANGINYLVRKRCFARNREEAVQQFQMMKVTAANSGSTAALEARMPRGNPNHFSAEIFAQVPHQVEKVRLDTAGGPVTVASLSAGVVGKTGAGSIKMDDLTGAVSITTGGGEVVAGALGPEATIKSGGGNVRVERIAGPGRISTGGGKVVVGSANGLVIDNGAGSIEVHHCAGDLKASTGGGNLSLGNVEGSVRVDAGAGSVRLASASGPVHISTGGGSVELFKLSQGAQVDTGAGAITVEFISSRGGFQDSSLHTAAGDVLVSLPSNLSVTVHASSDLAPGYGIRSEFPGLRISKQGGDYGPQSMWAEGALNGGGPALRIKTSIGHIDFREGQSY
jgi:DUF4097 and DUF4098 domain-containing protein YvlB